MNTPDNLKQHAPYFIRWVDAFVSPHSWRSMGEMEEAVAEESRTGTDSIGFFMGEHCNYLCFAAGFSEETDPTVYFNSFAIPKDWITRIELINVSRSSDPSKET